MKDFGKAEEDALHRIERAAVQPPTKTILTSVDAWVKSPQAPNSWPTSFQKDK